MFRFKIRKCVQKIRKWYYRRIVSTNRFEGSVNLLQPCIFNGVGIIEFESTIIGWANSNSYYNGTSYIEARNQGSSIYIGNSHINNNFCCVAQDGVIRIGNDCLIGSNISIINADFHPISVRDRHCGGGKSKDVIINDNVFIGSEVSIMKGVTIGKNSVIANGSVVFDDVPENSIVRGNPAVFYKKLEY